MDILPVDVDVSSWDSPESTDRQSQLWGGLWKDWSTANNEL
ncbi:hypothetical protein [Pseudomonas aeruginosa]|nr:hypothetical protein [Pseudomonas aeruginosa]